MNARGELFSVDDISEFVIATDEFKDKRGDTYKFACLLILHDGRELLMRFSGMDSIAGFADEFQLDNIRFDLRENAEKLGAELETAQRRARGELH